MRKKVRLNDRAPRGGQNVGPLNRAPLLGYEGEGFTWGPFGLVLGGGGTGYKGGCWGGGGVMLMVRHRKGGEAIPNNINNRNNGANGSLVGTICLVWSVSFLLFRFATFFLRCWRGSIVRELRISLLLGYFFMDLSFQSQVFFRPHDFPPLGTLHKDPHSSQNFVGDPLWLPSEWLSHNLVGDPVELPMNKLPKALLECVRRI